MSLYLRRQFAARVNDIMAGFVGADLQINLSERGVDLIVDHLEAPIGDEGYMDFSYILGQYGISRRSRDGTDGALVFTREPTARFDCDNNVNVPYSVLHRTFDQSLKGELFKVLSSPPPNLTND